MEIQNLAKYYKILELPEGASLADIAKSYKELKKLYSMPSLATLALNCDLFDGDNDEILEQIEIAYAELAKHFHLINKQNRKKIEDIVSKVGCFDGPVLKHIRETLNIDLLDISISSNIQLKHLNNIEKECFGELPKEVYVRGYLRSYAKFMSLDPQRVLDDYMLEYQTWRSKEGLTDSQLESFKSLR